MDPSWDMYDCNSDDVTKLEFVGDLRPGQIPRFSPISSSRIFLFLGVVQKKERGRKKTRKNPKIGLASG